MITKLEFLINYLLKKNNLDKLKEPLSPSMETYILTL